MFQKQHIDKLISGKVGHHCCDNWL